MKLVFVGESFGRHEAARGHPLVWWSGWELAQMLVAAELAPKPEFKYPGSGAPISMIRRFETQMIAYWSELRRNSGIAVTNVFNAHPDGDKTELFFASVGEPDLPSIRIKSRVLRLLPQHRHHVERLYDELFLLKPNLIVALGNFACWAILGKTSISAIRGTVSVSDRLGIKTLPTFHPAALRDEKLRPTIVADLKKARREAEFPEVRRIRRWITAERPESKQKVTLAEIRAWLAEPATSYATDIETGYALFTRAELKAMPSAMKRILAELIAMVSFARDAHHSVVIPFMTRDDPELNYWSLEEEIEVWKILLDVLNSDIPKCWQNGIFDLSHFLRNRIRVRNSIDDTMILHHALYAELPKALGYLGSIHSDEIAWKLMRSTGDSLKREE